MKEQSTQPDHQVLALKCQACTRLCAHRPLIEPYFCSLTLDRWLHNILNLLACWSIIEPGKRPMCSKQFWLGRLRPLSSAKKSLVEIVPSSKRGRQINTKSKKKRQIHCNDQTKCIYKSSSTQGMKIWPLHQRFWPLPCQTLTAVFTAKHPSFKVFRQ